MHCRYDALLIDRNDLETQYEERLNKAEEKYQVGPRYLRWCGTYADELNAVTLL